MPSSSEKSFHPSSYLPVIEISYIISQILHQGNIVVRKEDTTPCIYVYIYRGASLSRDFREMSQDIDCPAPRVGKRENRLPDRRRLWYSELQ
jgi:hypothetical protein